MGTATYDKPIKEIYGEAQITLSTTAAHSAVRPGYNELQAYGSAQWRMKMAPKLLYCLYYSAAAGTYTHYTSYVTDIGSTTHMPLDAMPIADIVYLGFSAPTRGVWFDVGTGVNAENASLDVEYCSTAVAPGATIAFTDVAADSDGTVGGSATLTKDGLYTWTVPTAWKRSTLGTVTNPFLAECYWIRLKPSIPLSATVDINEIIPAAYDTNYGWYEATTTYVIPINVAEVGGIEYKASSATPTLNLTWYKY
jgi:hypothetical protein